MGSDQRESGVSSATCASLVLRRIPGAPGAPSPQKGSPKLAPSQAVKSRIPSPGRRLPTREKGASILSSPVHQPSLSAKRMDHTPGTKCSKPILQSPLRCEGSYKDDDVQQRDARKSSAARAVLLKDNARKDGLQRDSLLRRTLSTSSGSLSLKRDDSSSLEAGARAPKQAHKFARLPSSGSAGPSSVKPAPSVVQAPQRSVSVSRDRLPGDTKSCLLRRSVSVSKGRTIMSQPDEVAPLLAGSKPRQGPLRASSAGSSASCSRPAADRRGASAGRLRPAGAGKPETLLQSSSKLAPITEAPSRPSAHATATSKHGTPSRPTFSLNLSSVKQQQQQQIPAPIPLKQESSSGPEESGPPVPKLDLGGILQKRAEEQALEPVFVVAPSEEVADTGTHHSQPDKRKSGSRAPSEGSAKEEPPEHFYLYPKVNPQEKKRIESLCRVIPKQQQAAVTNLFAKMVEARQNCEQMAFRGHRLLDQAQAEFRNRLAAKEEEVAQTKEEAAQWRQEAEVLRAQLAMLLSAQTRASSTDGSDPATGRDEQDGGQDGDLTSVHHSLLSTFDRMAWGSCEEGAGYSTFSGRSDA